MIHIANYSKILWIKS